ncbi:MAG: hypothetical protein ACREP4_09460 [Stenotrophomonas sp.]|uniref:hypothetical protein n=1 Tax=Stenotrophomonas sp. TaxID=69392 RepID=UPI003D6C80D8
MSDLLIEQNEENWSRGISTALNKFYSPDGEMDPAGFENAASIYLGMATGGRGFSEYYVHAPEVEQRIEANRELDALRDKLWEVFDPWNL